MADGNTGSDCTLFLCGDVMTGRGIDQVLPYAGNPTLHEPWVKDAGDYVALAEHAHGAIPRPLAEADLWGEALRQLDRVRPDLRFINLETSITTSNTPWPNKGIHYRMHPDNIGCLKVADIHGCSLANNHILDWDHDGLWESLRVLEEAGITTVGAGDNETVASEPAVFDVGSGRRVILLACGLGSSGIPESWAATADQPGVWRLAGLGEESVQRIADKVRAVKRQGDLVVLSIHWGGNWGYELEPGQQDFARAVIDEAGVDLVHGHSSHHPKAMEVYRGHLILYGCGDFINDYEGIQGHGQYRGDLVLMYFPTLETRTGRLVALTMVPLRMHRFQLRPAGDEEANWLAKVLDRECRRFDGGCQRQADGTLSLSWG